MKFFGMDIGDLIGPAAYDATKLFISRNFDAGINHVFRQTPDERRGELLAFIMRHPDPIVRENLRRRHELALRSKWPWAEDRFVNILSLYFVGITHTDATKREELRIEFFSSIGRLEVGVEVDDEKFEQVMAWMEDQLLGNLWKLTKQGVKTTSEWVQKNFGDGSPFAEKVESIRLNVHNWNQQQETRYLAHQQAGLDREIAMQNGWRIIRPFRRHPALSFLLLVFLIHLVVLVVIANQ